MLGPLRDVGNAIRALRIPMHDHIFYTRNLSMLTAGILAGHRCVFETYRPFADTFAFLRPYLRAIMARKNFIGAILHSQYTKTRYEKLGINPEKLLLAYNGHDPKQYEPRLTCHDAREQIGLPHDKRIVVYTGRISEEKGLTEVLNIAKMLPNILFVLVGSKEDGDIEHQARTFSNVTIFGWQTLTQLIRFLYAADVLLIPPCATPLTWYRKTVLPLKVFSYMASGRAILAPATPDITEILRNRLNAVLVEPNNTQAAANALEFLCNDPNERNRLAQVGLETVTQYTWDQRANRIREFLVRRVPATM